MTTHFTTLKGVAVPAKSAPTLAVPRQWTRTPEQDELVRAHNARIRRQYKGCDPRLIRELTRTDILTTAEWVILFELNSPTRPFQWYTTGNALTAIDQMPHPAGFPEPDASGGFRGDMEIRGTTYGRGMEWGWGRGARHWSPRVGLFVKQKYLLLGGKPRKGA